MNPAIEKAIKAVSKDRLRQHLENIVGIRHPATNLKALKRVETYVESTFKSSGYDVADHNFTELNSTFRNIIATKKGTKYPDEKILVMGHFDSVFNSPGADDNASGIAAVLEMAAVLRDVHFDRTVLFVGLNLEEHQQKEGGMETAGLIGSRALAKHAKENKWNIKGVLDFEMVGYAGDNFPQKAPAGFPGKLPPAGNFLAVVGNQNSMGLVQLYVQALQTYKNPLPFIPFVVPGNGEAIPDLRRSDHSPFWDQGWQALMITDTANFRNPNYHKETDTIDTLNFDFMASVVQSALGAIDLLSAR